MSPTVRHEAAPSGALVAKRPSGARRAHAYAWTVFAGALAVVVVLAARGAAWPSPGPLLLLALPLALCINRFVFYVNEVGVTGDAAVVFAAIVGFRHHAVWLGPLLLALLAGPLDAKHWEERAFVRMAFNSGSTALVATTAVAAFLGATEVLGESALALLVSALVAAVPAIVVESVLGVVLVTLHGEPVRTAVRHQVPVNTLAALLAVVGAGAGLLVGPLGWWATAAVLVPAAFLPELLLVRLPRRSGASVVGTVAAVLALVALAVSAGAVDSSSVPGVVVVGALALLAGLELVVTRRRIVSPMAGVLVAFAVGLGSSAPLVVVGAAVAALVTAVGWASDVTGASSRPALRGVALAAIIGALSVAVAERVQPPVSVFVAAIVATASFAVIAALVVSTARDQVARFLWAAPLVIAVAALGRVAGIGTGGAAVVSGVVVVVAIMAAACFGALPWPSGGLGRWGARRRGTVRRFALATAAAVALGAVVVALGGSGSSAHAAGFVAVAAAELEVGMALLAVRQWRFAPRPRAVQTATLTAASVAALAASGAIAAGELLGGAAIVVVVAVATVVGAPLARIGQRKPESCSASR
jgi:hypothetical protein